MESNQPVLEYLSDEFQGFSVTFDVDPASELPTYVVSRGAERYRAAIDPAVLGSTDSSSIRQLLHDYNLADVMRQLGDFCVVVTPNGCVFA